MTHKTKTVIWEPRLSFSMCCNGNADVSKSYRQCKSPSSWALNRLHSIPCISHWKRTILCVCVRHGWGGDLYLLLWSACLNSSCRIKRQTLDWIVKFSWATSMLTCCRAAVTRAGEEEEDLLHKDERRSSFCDFLQLYRRKGDSTVRFFFSFFCSLNAVSSYKHHVRFPCPHSIFYQG